MAKQKITTGVIRTLIKEAIHDRIRMIDEAGDVAALEAKIAKVGEDIDEAGSLKDTLLGIENLKHHVNPKTLNAMVKELDSTIKMLDKKRGELEKQKSKLAGGTRTSAIPEDDDLPADDSVDLGADEDENKND